ncbi:MAG TPA: hypothetical protein VLG49_03595 [Rhabdochlamydiaceae bacterium]|nr:hypothetical protein [Rhabdochlamydiaceae bacterium]
MNSRIGILTQPALQLCSSKATPKQAMCKHMADGGGCKAGDAGAVKNQFLSLLGYILKSSRIE